MAEEYLTRFINLDYDEDDTLVDDEEEDEDDKKDADTDDDEDDKDDKDDKDDDDDLALDDEEE